MSASCSPELRLRVDAPCPRAARDLLVVTAFLAVISMMVSGSATADVTAFHSPNDDGIAAPTLPVLSGAEGATLDLYIDLSGAAPTVTGVACEDGDGDELCAWEVEWTGGPGVWVGQFVPEPGVRFSLEGDTYRANGLHALNPQASPSRIGRLRVARRETQGGVVAIRGVAIRADLTLDPLPSTTVARVPAPEPTIGFTLGSGAVLLVRLAIRRRTRESG